LHLPLTREEIHGKEVETVLEDCRGKRSGGLFGSSGGGPHSAREWKGGKSRNSNLRRQNRELEVRFHRAKNQGGRSPVFHLERLERKEGSLWFWCVFLAQGGYSPPWRIHCEVCYIIKKKGRKKAKESICLREDPEEKRGRSHYPIGGFLGEKKNFQKSFGGERNGSKHLILTRQ